MKTSRFSTQYWWVIGLILGAAMSRLLPHPYNFTPIGGIALFGAAYFKRREWSIIVPLVAMWLSDMVLNNWLYADFYPKGSWVWTGVPSVYLSIICITLLGFTTLQRLSVGRVLGSAVGASLLFFLITNFDSWWGNPLYPQTAQGLLMSYAAGLPFLKNTIAGDLCYSALLFGAMEFLQYRFPRLAYAR